LPELDLRNLVSFFSNADEKLVTDFQKQAVVQSFTKGTFLSMEGDACQYFPIVKSGLIRVYKLGPKGQEMTLYRIEPGQSCILTISCLLSNHNFPALAVVEEDCEVVLIQEKILREWLSKYNQWNQYIFDYLSQVLMNVLKILENISFKRTDTRIIEYLLSAVINLGYEIKTTHQKLALDIGTAREVVSRSLKNLEKQNMIELQRGKIIVKDLDKLKKELTLLQ
jgi:CRP/FNR family transcriptional regulator